MSNLIRELKEQKGYFESEKMIAEFMLENYRSMAAMITQRGLDSIGQRDEWLKKNFVI